MSTISTDELRARIEIANPDDEVLQDIIDEEEAWLESKIGPLGGERVETFLLAGYGFRPHELILRRRAAVLTEVTDNGTVLLDANVELRGNGRMFSRILGQGAFLGPVVTVKYTPSDALLVRSVLIGLIGIAIGEFENSAGYSSELMGSYQYQLAAGATTKVRKRLLSKITGGAMPTSMHVRSSLSGRPIYPSH